MVALLLLLFYIEIRVIISHCRLGKEPVEIHVAVGFPAHYCHLAVVARIFTTSQLAASLQLALASTCTKENVLGGRF